MNKRGALGITALALGAAVFAAYRWLPRSDPAVSATADAPAAAASAARAGAQTVSVFAALQRDLPVTVEAAGTVVSLDTVDIRAQVAGSVSEVVVREGQFVRRGDVLFRLDDRAHRADLERARAQLLRDQASLADLNRQLTRAQDLRAQNFIAQSAVDTVLAQVEAQKAAVAADQAAIRSSEVALSFDTITSPLSGRAGAVVVYRGSLVQPAASPMVTISQIDPIGVSFTLPEAQLAAVLRASGLQQGVATPRNAAAAAAARPATAASAAGSGTIVVSLPNSERGRGSPANDEMTGRITFVDNAVDTTTGTIRVKGEVPNESHRLWPGQYVTVRMTLRTIPGAIVIPQNALIIRGNERSVYVVKPDATVEARPVQPRYNAAEMVAVDGLEAGEKVVVEGKQNLRPGSAVRETPYAAPRRAQGTRGAASGTAAPANGSSAGASL
ncbi:MAG TPA: efflux RND transporter periplasmic adaptor subunit [Burkholderiaceae bacterium]|nr:efflux RND transporter periplasmic adaptor subunit [Burkholderiaceae bacterium]